MDQESFEQMTVSKELLGGAVLYLKDGLDLEIIVNGDEVIGVDLPITVELKITQTEPGFRGDTASGGTKPATLETGLVVNIPLFIGEGETIKVDTRSNTYLERVNN